MRLHCVALRQRERARVRMSDSATPHTGAEMRNLKTMLAPYHALVVEGPARSDTRDPKQVATALYASCQKHWNKHAPKGELVLITQGDPPLTTGIAPICRELQDMLSVKRAVLTWDKEHAESADRYGGIAFELNFLELARVLDDTDDLAKLQNAVANAVSAKNQMRDEALPPYVRKFALLQEVSKAVLCKLCTDVTIIHTVERHEIDPQSITTFYQVGLDVGLVPQNAYVRY